MYYPSTADAKNDDMTIKRCIDIAKFNDYGSISVYNIQEDVFDSSVLEDSPVVLAWGNKLTKTKSEKMIKLFKESGLNLLCFGKLKNGNPSLPTRLSKNTEIVEY